jgi:hypothetical protein
MDAKAGVVLLGSECRERVDLTRWLNRRRMAGYLRTTAIDHRQTMAAFPANCRRSRDLFDVGLRELNRSRPERVLEADANVSAKRTASRN